MVLKQQRKGVLFCISYHCLSCCLIFHLVSVRRSDLLDWVTCPRSIKSFKLQFHLLLRGYRDVAMNERGYLTADILSSCQVLNLKPLSIYHKVNVYASAMWQRQAEHQIPMGSNPVVLCWSGQTSK